jgi:hypothetical protein
MSTNPTTATQLADAILELAGALIDLQPPGTQNRLADIQVQMVKLKRAINDADVGQDLCADRAYHNGFLQACREFGEALQSADAGRMSRRCSEISERYRRDCASWGQKP